MECEFGDLSVGNQCFRIKARETYLVLGIFLGFLVGIWVLIEVEWVLFW